ncbi:hypothetical protein ACFLRQ_03060, partial [Bacteroidota bacterium]
MTIGGDTLYIGGSFTTIGGQARNYVSSYNITENSLTALNPDANNVVNALSFFNNKLYIGGTFTNVSSSSRVSLAEFDVLTNTLTTFNPGVITTTGINALFCKDSSLYHGGGFSYSNQGAPIRNLAALNPSGNSISY